MTTIGKITRGAVEWALIVAIIVIANWFISMRTFEKNLCNMQLNYSFSWLFGCVKVPDKLLEQAK
jgi:hypothetical protein